MIEYNCSQPIGIFDSGIGGLTVARALAELLPHENIIYFGDTAYLPYGNKSFDIINARALKIADFFLQKKCKLFIIACNSASAASFSLLHQKYAAAMHVMNVIDPVVDYIGRHYADQKLGLIGTSCTIDSEVYFKKINALDKNIVLKSLATPKLVPMIEDGSLDKKIITQYLSNDMLSKIDALILGCTHYPLIKTEIEDFYEGKVNVIDSPKIVAKYMQKFLQENNLLNLSSHKTPHFYASDLNDNFILCTKNFFSEDVCLSEKIL